MPGESDHEKGREDETITCPHCRYEYEANEQYCSICGYPWPWLRKRNED
jgi:ribosomal protein L37E